MPLFKTRIVGEVISFISIHDQLRCHFKITFLYTIFQLQLHISHSEHLKNMFIDIVFIDASTYFSYKMASGKGVSEG